MNEKGIQEKILSDLSEEEHNKIIQLYQYQNYTSDQIGKIFNVSKSTMDKYRYEHNIHRLYKDEKWFISKFVDEKLSLQEISNICGCSLNTVTRAAINHGLHARNKPRHLKINEDFFSTYTKKSCYWAGFINADGHLEKRQKKGKESFCMSLSINLSYKDYEHLKKFNKTLSRDNLIREYETNDYRLYNFSLKRHKICFDLNNNFDIAFNHKSLNEKVSYKIPKEFLKDFLRGHFDGDGSISVTKNAVFMTVVGSKVLCERFKEILSEEYNKDIGAVVQDSKNPNMYLYRITNMKDCVLMYLYMYYPYCVCLERKRDKFKEILRKI